MTPRLPRSIVGLATLASLALGLATAGLGTIVYLTSHEALEEQLDSRIATETGHLVATARQHGVAALAAAIGARENGHVTTDMGYALFAPSGARVAGRLASPRPPPGWHELLPFARPDEQDARTAQALVSHLGQGYVLVVAADRTPVDEIDATIIRLFAAAFGAMLVVGIGCAWLVGLVVRRRLHAISATAEAIIDGDLGRRVARDGSRTEFDRLAETLNRMLDRNQALLTNLRQVTSDIAHDLRTPLARQQQALDAALARPPDLTGDRETIRVAADTGQEILDLFAAMLRISEIETHQVRETFRPVDLAELVERVADAFRASAEASGHTLTVQLDAAPAVAGDRHLLSRMLANLVENALRHTPAGTAVTIALAAPGGAPTIAVADDGPGIAEADHARVLERFVRLEASRTTPGHGLGMSMAAAIAGAHFATLSLAEGAPGLRVAIRFPRADG